MERPVWYMQTDKKWKNVDYSTKGENTTIGASGCGPTCMAMVIATWVDSNVTPVTTCAWSLEHGYKAKNQGTYYTYFKPQGEVYNIKAYQLTPSNIYGKTDSDYHEKAKAEVERGNFVIACMGKGRWTSSGHFVLWYGNEKNSVLLNDPASTAKNRNKASFDYFKSQVKYYFVCEKPENVIKEADEAMTMEEKKAFEALSEKVKSLESQLTTSKLFARLETIEKQTSIYNYIDINMPDWAKPTIIKLVNNGLLTGTDEGLGLTMDLMRLLVILDRAEMFE